MPTIKDQRLTMLSARLLFEPSGSRLPPVDAQVSPLSLATRLWFAWACFFRVLFDGIFARRVHELDAAPAEASASSAAAAVERRTPGPPTASTPVASNPNSNDADSATSNVAGSSDAALQLLALLQREGRLIDFLQQDVAGFPDAAVGAAARVVHDGCQKALASHLEIKPVRSEREGGSVTIDVVDANAVKLVGNVRGNAPFRGTLRHRGWRVESVKLPTLVAGYDARVLAPAEVEL
jgi:hypothetical protein